MKNLYILTILILLTITTPSFAAGNNITVNVNGLVCDFCARAIEKVFSRQEEVETITVDLDEKLITITFKENADINDETITTLITDSGYNVVSINREEDTEDE